MINHLFFTFPSSGGPKTSHAFNSSLALTQTGQENEEKEEENQQLLSNLFVFSRWIIMLM